MKSQIEQERYAQWVDAVVKLQPLNWYCVSGWKFKSPSGTFHDLSCANLDMLSVIESKGVFKV